MTVAHKDLTGTSLHETKGIGSASADTVHVRVSAGVSGWAKITEANIDNTSIKNTNLMTLTAAMDDISTAGSIRVVVPYNCSIIAIYSVISGAITTADCNITAKIGATPMTNGTITVAYSGSAAGDVDSCTPTANNTLTAGQAITLESDGASSSSVSATFTIVMEL